MTNILADSGEAAPTARPRSGLARLISPVDPATFQREHWEREPLFVRRDDPDYYADLLTLDAVDEALTFAGADLDGIRVVADGRETKVSSFTASHDNNALEALYVSYRSGATIVLNALEQRHAPLQRFARLLGTELSCRIQMNIYVTPARNQGFAPHYDTHDVFVAQVHGSKRWRLAGQPYELPRRGDSYDKSQPVPEPEYEFELTPGDLLYLPRGTVHWATADQRDTSAHITMGVHPVLYTQVVMDALTKLTAEDVRLRQGLPIGFAHDARARREARDRCAEMIASLARALSPTDMVDDAVRKVTSIGLPGLRNHLTDLERLDRVDLRTRVRRRPDLAYAMTVADDVVSLDFHHKTVRLPAIVADEIRYLAETDGATAASIPGDLDEPGRLVLVTTLLREGFLTCG